MSELVKIERDGGVLVVTLARPEKKNALTGAMYEKLLVAFADAAQDDAIGALLIEGSGGVCLAKSGLAARRLPAERGRIGLARFFAEKLATAAPGLAQTILSGAAPLDGCASILAESA